MLQGTLAVAGAIAFAIVIRRFQKARRIDATRYALLLAAAIAQRNADERSRSSQVQTRIGEIKRKIEHSRLAG